MAEINNVIAEASQDLQTIEDFVNLPAGSDVRPRLLPSVNVGTLAGTRDAIFEAGGLPAKPFATKALMTASALADGQYAMVTNDTANNGLYVKTAGAWVKSSYDPVVQSATYTDTVKVSAKTYTDEKTAALFSNNDVSNIPLLVDANNKILIGYDAVNDKAIIAGLDGSESATQETHRQPKQLNKLSKSYINHYLFYGQSLSVGATATTILSTSQPYSNLTFNTSPRMDTAATSVIPLVEQFNSPSSDGRADRGETVCSGAANYATRSMMLENSITPDSHVIFASTAGHGGYRIDQLEEGTAWYDVFKNHVTQAKSLNTGTYKVQVVGWIQGENDAVTGYLTSFDVYRAKLENLQKDVSVDAKLITGQTDDVEVITYQMSYAAATHSDVALAQLDLVKESDKFHLSTPMYHFPYASDKVHLTNVGYKWLGAYFGRAYKQRVIDNRKPDFINPLSATLSGNKVTVKFDVPMQPLVFDSTTLALTTDNGFKVTDNAGIKINISSMSASGDSVVLTLATTPAANVTVKYALDYLGAGLIFTGGASGNLRDSTTDSVVIAGTTKPLYHVCPHFKITAFIDKGI